MKSKIALALALLFLAPGCASTENKEDPLLAMPGLEEFRPADRVLILAPHPDDEAIACAGVIQEALAKKAAVRVAYLTNGDRNQWAFIAYKGNIAFRPAQFIHLGEIRRDEAIAAMQALGLKRDDLVFLGYPDFGIFHIFSRYWQTKERFSDILTHISRVPYKDNPSFGADYNGENVLRDLKKAIADFRPNKIFVSHPADANFDHKTLYLFTEVALSDLEGQLPRPKLYPYLVHCVGWPQPRHYHPNLRLSPPPSFAASQIRWQDFVLSDAKAQKKRRAVLSYRSQTRCSAFYLFSFCRRNELFGAYPDIELENQVSPKEQGISFFEFAPLFSRPKSVGPVGISGNVSELKKERGISYALVDRALLIRVEKDKALQQRAVFMFCLFGYSKDRPFSQMPKIRIISKYLWVKVFDKNKLIAPAGIAAELQSDSYVLRIPLAVLGDPDFILASAKGYYGKPLPIDAAGFRKIVIKRGEAEDGGDKIN
jgi:LmbE family N-acetylglucosaminyl deacetylase